MYRPGGWNGEHYLTAVCASRSQQGEQGETVEIEASASAALQNPVPGLGGQSPFPRITTDMAPTEPSKDKKPEYDNPYFEPQYGFPSEDDPEAEEHVESYTPRFNQSLNGNKCVLLVHRLNECAIVIQMSFSDQPWQCSVCVKKTKQKLGLGDMAKIFYPDIGHLIFR